MSTEFTRCEHPDLPGQAVDIPTDALEGWQGHGWVPVGESRTAAEALVAEVNEEAAAQAVAVEVPDLTIPQILDEVGDDPAKAQAALDAELARETPRKTLVDRLTPKAGQPGDPEGN